MIERNQARILAREKIDEIERSGSVPLGINAESQHEAGWVFYYNSMKFIETGDFHQMLGGNGPVVVLHAGEVLIVPVTRGVEEFAGPKVESDD